MPPCLLIKGPLKLILNQGKFDIFQITSHADGESKPKNRVNLPPRFLRKGRGEYSFVGPTVKVVGNKELFSFLDMKMWQFFFSFSLHGFRVLRVNKLL